MWMTAEEEHVPRVSPYTVADVCTDTLTHVGHVNAPPAVELTIIFSTVVVFDIYQNFVQPRNMLTLNLDV